MTEPTIEAAALLHKALRRLKGIADQQGTVLYSGHSTLAQGEFYLMGYNPGGSTGARENTIWHSLASLEAHKNAYTREKWADGGRSVLQERVCRLLAILERQAESILTTNALFTRSRTADAVEGGWDLWWDHCWPVHQLLLAAVRPRLIISMGRQTTELLRCTTKYTERRVPWNWAESDQIRIGPARLVPRVSFMLDERQSHTCAVLGLPHPSPRVPEGWDEDELKAAITGALDKLLQLDLAP